MIDVHYDWLEKWLPTIASNLGIERDIRGAIVAEGDKCYSKRSDWESIGIPFPHGVAMYILTKIHPWSKEVRETSNGWIDPFEWIAANYPKLKEHFPTEDLEYWLPKINNK